jgi:single-stranded-DNA-specific exonuclease
MEKRWVEYQSSNTEVINQLADQLNITTIIATLLVNRGITNYDEAKEFFRPDLLHLHDPFLMKDMEKAIERIEKAIANEEKILVYGDYDVDGTTAVSLVYSFLQNYYSHIDYYIPDRYKEGYGISIQGIDWAAEHHFSLVIALDCGIRAIDKIEYANSKNIDFIICDHHLPGDEIPKALAVLDPKRIDCDYPFKELSGCGVGFKLVQAFCQKNDIPFEKIEPLLDLVVVSIASDLVPVTDENRTLSFFGLLQMNFNPRPGLKALMELAGKQQDITISDIVFFIGPRINAAGRIDDAEHAVQLLTAANEQIALEQCNIVNTKNTERKEFDQNITIEAMSMIENNEFYLHRKSTVLFNPTWHKGVIGIVASRLLDRFYRPTIILTESNGIASGSARSVNGYDIHKAIGECADLLEQFGGHKYAAGLTLKIENVDAFIERFEKVVSSTIEERSLFQEIEIESELELKDFTTRFFRILKQFSPHGPGNMKPIFLSRNVYSPGEIHIVGKVNSNHLKFSIKQQDSPLFECIGFGLGSFKEKIQPNQHFDICYTVEENIWRDKVNIQLNIKDIRV